MVINHWINFVLGFKGYFLLGYFLDRAVISRGAERMIYAAGKLSGAAAAVMTLLLSVSKNEADEMFYSGLWANIMCEAAAVLVFSREIHSDIVAIYIRGISR